MTTSARSADLGQTRHCFGDSLAGLNPQERNFTDQNQCQELILAYGRQRLSTLCDTFPNREPHLLLSGGVDSIFIAALCAEKDIPAKCWTVSITPGGTEELTAAQQAAKHLGLQHETVELTVSNVKDLAQAAISLLGSTELWEIAAAVPLSAAVARISADAPSPLILTGGGADACLAGGYQLTTPVNSVASQRQLEADIHETVRTSFTENRLVPYFHDKLLGAAAKGYVDFFQTEHFWEVTRTFSPTVLFTETPSGGLADKACLRNAASSLGVPSDLVWRKKNPLQFSTGVVAALSALARRYCLEWPGSTTYTNPAAEPAEVILARYALQTIAKSSVDS